MGLPAPTPDFSPELKKKLKAQRANATKTENKRVLSVAQYQADLLDKLDTTESRAEMHAVLGDEKETLRLEGRKNKGNDKFAADKLKVVDAVIEQAPNVEAMLSANRLVKKQLDDIKSTTEVSGDAAIVHFIKNELRVATSLSNALIKAYQREPEKMTVSDTIDSLRAERKDFKKALMAEKETQVAAFAIRSDKETWAKVSADPVLAMLIDQKAKQKPTAALAQYQMSAGSMDKNVAATLYNEVAGTHKYLVETFTGSPQTASALKKKDLRTFESMAKYAETLKTAERASPLNLKGFKVEQKKSAFDMLLSAQKQR